MPLTWNPASGSEPSSAPACAACQARFAFVRWEVQMGEAASTGCQWVTVAQGHLQPFLQDLGLLIGAVTGWVPGLSPPLSTVCFQAWE